MLYLIYTIHIIVCIFLILVVLLQQGKGADLSVFGGGSTQTVFGARGAATFLHKMTVIGFIAFTLTTISIGLMSGSAQSSVMRGAEAPAAAEQAPAAAEEVPATTEEAPAAVEETVGETATEATQTPAETGGETESSGATGDGSNDS